MKKISEYIFIFSILASISFAIDLDNTTHNLGLGDCVNATFNDSWMFICGASSMNIDRNIGFGDTYTNSTYNISIHAPQFPLMNATIELSLGGIYTNSTYNISVYAPNSSKINQNVSKGWGETYTNADANITINCAALPTISSNISAGQIYTQYTFSFKCNYPSYNVIRTLDFGETVKYDDIALNVTCPDFPRLNLAKQLEIGEQYTPTDARYNLSLTCKYVNIAELTTYQTLYSSIKSELDALKIVSSSKDTQISDKDSQIANKNTLIELLQANNSLLLTKATTLQLPTTNYNCTYTRIMINGRNITYCPEDITSLCTPEEKLSGRLPDCINRLANDSVSQKETLTQQLTACTSDKQRCESGENLNQQNADMWSLIIVGLIASVGGAWLIVSYLQYKRTQDTE